MGVQTDPKIVLESRTTPFPVGVHTDPKMRTISSKMSEAMLLVGGLPKVAMPVVDPMAQ